MEGYSVTEAASILGVPTERVWELLARGVLAGTSEGETGMRVYLQPRPAPAPPAAATTRSNGDPAPREPDPELSPFRELLTEFRNLTERYGQALLALGEARGEGAALRSRVDLLEARMDLRLPMAGGMPPPTPWPAPLPESMVRPPVPEREAAHDDDSEAGEFAADEDRPSRRRRSARHATESFAEALARAEDPTRPELPGAADADAALAALRAEASVEASATDAALPRELPAAESMPTLDESQEPATAAPVEAAEPEPTAMGPLPEPMEAATPGLEPQPEPEAEPPAAESAAEPMEAAIAEPEPEQEPMVETVAPEAEPEPEPEPEAAAAAQAETPAAEQVAPPEPQPETAPISFDPERYTVAIEEPDWWVEEEPASTATAAEVAEKSLPLEEAPTHVEEAPPATAPVPSVERSSRHEETMLWFGMAPEATPAEAGDGAEEMEVAGGSTSRPSHVDLPGSRELDEALAALDVLAGRTPPSPTAEPEAPPEAERTPTAEPASEPASEPEPEARTAWPTADRSAATHQRPEPRVGSASTGFDALRPSSTPASRAYRRLRRIFPS